MNEQAEKFIENVLKNNIVETIITIAISILLYSIIKKLCKPKHLIMTWYRHQLR